MCNLDTVIGVEIHVVVNTRTKMFSPAKNSHVDSPNTNLSPIDLALPGTIPSVNKEVIVKAIQLAKGLEMKDIDLNLRFDRKNYFYQDLPKGFQITQHYFPFARNGKIEITTINGQSKKIDVSHFHIEEDTAKQIKLSEQDILLDFNRAGSPLFEIVTGPVFSNSSEVQSYLINLRRILLALNVSDGRMEEGSMRVDVNVSIKPSGILKLGPKVEIKNINSILNVVKAIDFEVDRQRKLIFLNKPVKQETRFFDDKANVTVFMRNKSDAIDYRYMTEPNILCIQLSKKFVKEALDNFPMLPNQLRRKYRSENLTDNFIEILLENPNYQKILQIIDQNAGNLQESACWLFIELFGILNKSKVCITTLKQNVFFQMGILIKRLQEQVINNKQSKKLLQMLVQKNNDETIDQLIDECGYKQLCDEEFIRSELVELLNNHTHELTNYSTRPERVEKFFIGLLMKKNNGAVNPKISIKILRQLINEHFSAI